MYSNSNSETFKAIRIRNSGFTLMELIIVIIIMGVMSLGIAGFIKLSTQTYLNVTERDELLANARFSVERLNREVRNAVPNSVRVATDDPTAATKQCLEFVMITASTVYTELSVAPKDKADKLNVIPFVNNQGNVYSCNNTDCGEKVVVYPLSPADVYSGHDDNLSKVFTIETYTAPELSLTAGEVNFKEYSPTSRAFIFKEPVSYCVESGELNRYSGYSFNTIQVLPPNVNITNGNESLMAKNLSFDANDLPFDVVPASLQRNAVVQIKLNFIRDGEQVIFDHAIHIKNIP